MIKVTRLNGKSFQINALYIETVESFPDTTITLTNGKKYIVAESVEVLQERIVDFYNRINLLSSKKLGVEKDE
ncbi:flagellar FlbD family protein [Lederbergia graminis]|uniref:Flagellar FlbD family protein n=1 Tax=Lederbergia graminis TaxID=735518 RepID=A0ABW0LD00_9BACI|nr:flagellar FlbD family protein [Paenibacillus bovis]HLU21897.1 flagellar FlbD family protein [Bacillaceae bacterium]